ncbi:TPA: winged helix-turn-helix transcriptional regulator [Candidatus Woesearchaeota archaeon]|nr:winged helix-turn-helix transcriptional regulator [Candidatus Woesearchaeota archaeon]
MVSEPPYKSEHKALALAVRKKIFSLVIRYAGCHFRELERISKLAPSTLSYHLHYLVKGGLLSEIREGNTRRYFPQVFKHENKKILSLLRQESMRKILLVLLINDSCQHQELCERVHVSPSTISWHLKKLEESHVVTCSKEGRTTRYSLSIDKEELVKLIITYQETFLDTLVDRVVEMWEA